MCIYLQGSLAPAAEHKPWINQHCFFLPNDKFNLKISQKSDDFFILELKHLETRNYESTVMEQFQSILHIFNELLFFPFFVFLMGICRVHCIKHLASQVCDTSVVSKVWMVLTLKKIEVYFLPAQKSFE